MAYENMTYENILTRMLDTIVVNYPNIDTREGSMIYNACAAAAIELAIMYVELNNVRNESFVETASREYKLIGCEDVGIDTSIFNATYGVFKGQFNVKVPIGSRWNYDLYNFTVTEFIEQDTDYFYKLQCETAGSAPNTSIGALTPISDVPSGLTTAELVECLIFGEDEATNEYINEYYSTFVNSDISDGNVAQYRLWCENYTGIGNYKIVPLWNGANTVKVLILSAENTPANEELVSSFQDYLDPPTAEINDTTTAENYPQGRGMGNGEAPIGAIVTVATATQKDLVINCTGVLQEGYASPVGVEEAITNYLSSIAYEKNTVSYMSIGAAILSCDSMDSIVLLTINGSSTDVTLNDNEVGILTQFNFTKSGE